MKMKRNEQHMYLPNTTGHTAVYSHFPTGQSFIKLPEHLYSLPLSLEKQTAEANQFTQAGCDSEI